MRHAGLSIARRMALGFAALLLVLGALLAAVLSWQADSARAQRNFTEHARGLGEAAVALERSILTLAIELRSYLLQPDPGRLERHHRTAAEVRAALQRLGALPMEPDGAAIFEELAPAVGRYLASTEELAVRRADSKLTPASDLEISASRQAVTDVLHRYISLQQAKTTRALREIEIASNQVSRGLVTGAVLAMLVFIVLAWATTQSVRRPAHELLKIASALQQGHWRPALAWAPPETAGQGAGTAPPVRNELLQIARAFGSAAVALERRETRLSAERQVAQATAASVVRTEVAAQALRAVVEHTRAELGIVYVAGQQQRLRAAASHGITGPVAELAPGDGLPGQAALERRMLRVDHIPDDAAFSIGLGYDAAPPRCVAAAPIVWRETLVGVLLVASLRSFDDDTLQFLEDAATQLGVGLNNVNAYEQIQQLLAELEHRNRQVQAQNAELHVRNKEVQVQREELQAQNEELQAQAEEIRAQNDELATRSAALRAQAAQLAQADRRKTEFLGVLAHELRNPMAGISNSLALLSRPEVQGEPHLARVREIIARQIRQLNRLIDDLLDVTRVSQGKIALQRQVIDLVKLVHDHLEDQRTAVEAAGLHLQRALPGHPVWVDGDALRLTQVIGNLLDNAIKFSDPGGRINVTLESDPARSCARLAVADAGIGIEPTVMARLFEPFSQGDMGVARKNDGLGLGLSLVRSLVQMHGGTVQASSEGAGQGACFTVELPLAAGPGTSSGKAHGA